MLKASRLLLRFNILCYACEIYSSCIQDYFCLLVFLIPKKEMRNAFGKEKQKEEKNTRRGRNRAREREESKLFLSVPSADNSRIPKYTFILFAFYHS
jgi:hypothetical protein